MRTFGATVFGGLVMSIAAVGCAHFDRAESMTPVRDASTRVAAPVTTASTAPVDSREAKKTFCDVFEQEIKKTEDTTTRFSAASRGDEQHPQTDWGDPDHWFADMANDASIIFGYAADTLQAQITSSLPVDLSAKAKDLIVSMRKLSALYQQHEAVSTLKDEMKNGYAPPANGIDTQCKAS